MSKHVIFYIALFAAIMISSCSNKERSYAINGTVSSEKKGDYIMLFKYRGDSIYAVDTTIISEGTFKFSGEETLHDIAIVTTGNYPDIVRAAEVVLERGEIEVYLDSISEVKGTPLNELYSEHKTQNKKFEADISALRQQNEHSINANEEHINEKFAAHKKYLVDFYKENITNPVGRRTFKEYSPWLQNKDIYQIYELLPEDYKSDPVIVDRIKRCKEEDKKNNLRGQLIGQKYTDFELFTPDKSLKKLSDYVGKSEFLLIDFWASYCSPCIAKVPERKAIYDKYKDKGFQIISISLDNSLSQWQTVINKVDAPWIHLSDLKDKSPLAETYHIVGIPFSILLDKEGTIIQVRVHESILNEILEKSLGEI